MGGYFKKAKAQTGSTIELIWDFDTSLDTNGDGSEDGDDDKISTNAQTKDSFVLSAMDEKIVELQYQKLDRKVGVKLTVRETDSDGNIREDSVTRQLTLLDPAILPGAAGAAASTPPQANFQIKKNGTIVEFFNFSTDSQGAPLNDNSQGYLYHWDYDQMSEPGTASYPENTDNNTANDIDSGLFKPLAHDYQKYEVYTIRLTVTNPAGLSDQKTTTVRLSESLEDSKISAKISANTIKGYAPLVVEFTSDGSRDQEGSISNISWDWGDGTESVTGSNRTTVSHTYETPGHYRAGVAIAGPSGNAASYVFIDVLSSEPEATILIDGEGVGQRLGTYQAFVDTPVNLDAFVKDPETVSPSDFSFEWSYGDENPKVATNKITSYTYTQTGEYTLSLTVTSKRTSLSKTITRQVRVSTAPPSPKIIAQGQEMYDRSISKSDESYFGSKINSETGTFRISFSASDSLGAPVDIDNNQYTEIKALEWDMGDGNTRSSVDKNEKIEHIYEKEGSYTLKLTVYDENDISYSGKKIIFLADSDQPVPRLTLTPSEASVGDSVRFDASQSFASNKIVDYRWRVGYSPFSDSDIPISFVGKTAAKKFALPTKGSGYDIELTVKDSLGKENTITVPNALKIKPEPPKAYFDIEATDAPNVFYFDATESELDMAYQSAATYTWDWGDGSDTEMGLSAKHLFEQAGKYEVVLIVRDDGNETTFSRLLTVKTNLVADIVNADPTAGIASVTNPLRVSMVGVGGQNLSSGIDDYVVSSSVWDWGDGATSYGDSVDHAYTDPGRYQVKYTIYDVDDRSASDTKIIHVGKENSPLAIIDEDNLRGTKYKNQLLIFDATRSLTAEGFQDQFGEYLEYEWNMGDGSPELTAPTVEHSYRLAGEYDVTLVVRDLSVGSISEDKVRLRVINASPTATFSTDKTLGSSPMLVSVDASESTDPDGMIVQYLWDWGDDSTVITQTAETNHIFTNTTSRSRTYRVTLTTVDDDGSQASAKQEISVEPAKGSISDFSYTPDSGSSPLKVTFNAGQSRVESGSITQYLWDFGDNTEKTTKLPIIEHTFTNTTTKLRQYDVKLKIIDSEGRSAITSKTIYVNGVEKITADLKVNPLGGDNPFSVRFDASRSKGENNALISGYYWDFGDGETLFSEDSKIIHTYKNDETGKSKKYIASVKIIDKNGNEASTQQAVYVNGK